MRKMRIPESLADNVDLTVPGCTVISVELRRQTRLAALREVWDLFESHSMAGAAGLVVAFEKLADMIAKEEEAK